MSRLSRNRIIWPLDANEIIRKGARKWSQRPFRTESVCIKQEGMFGGRVVHLRWQYGTTKFSILPRWEVLEADARKERRQFCLLEERKRSVERHLYRRERDSEETRLFINRLKKDLAKHVKDNQIVR
jgi:hypothetical protein